jgi:chondroitin 4-sulfotransferase 11
LENILSSFVIDYIRKIWDDSPEAVTTPVNMLRYKSYWNRANCIFIHVPKAAGTSVSQALYGKHLRHFSAQEINRYAKREFQSLFSFGIVRNPWARVLSAYRFAKIGHTGSMGIKHPEQYEIPEFESFERFLTEWLSEKDPLKIDLVFQPQSKFVCDQQGDIMLDYIGRLENLTEVENDLSDRLEQKIIFPRLNSTSNESDDYQSAYKSQDMRDIVGNAYAADIQTFGYSF